MRIQGVDHVAFAVADHQWSIAWYPEVLGLAEDHPEWERHPAMLLQAGSRVALFPAQEREPGFLHLAFRVDGASFEVVDHGTAPLRCFHDHDGVQLELTTYDVG